MENPDILASLLQISSASVVCGAHVLSFQPVESKTNEDRYFVQDWVLENGEWKVLAVLDGGPL